MTGKPCLAEPEPQQADAAVASCSAFQGGRRVAHGRYADVAAWLAARAATEEPVLVFDDASGALVDQPLPQAGVNPSVAEASDKPSSDQGAASAAGVGRPRLGVVAREVTLLPRHWAWLAEQRGGASAALRRLVDEARQRYLQADLQRQSRERAYRFMSVLAADWPGFEEASRALFAGDGAGFAARTAAWPADVAGHLAWLARDAFTQTPASGA